jgi:pimeloyl-ACP methyl ester carboxylesterase
VPSPISPAAGTKPTNTRRGRAWIDRAAGVRIGFTLASISPGRSKTVLLIHGAPQTGYARRKVVPTLVAAGYQVVVPDYRGAGASTKPRDGYDKWTRAGDLHHLVRNELGIEDHCRWWDTILGPWSRSPARCGSARTSSA